MKQLLITALIALSGFTLQAQDALPKGFVAGSITLADNSQLQGFIKENIRSKASLQFLATANGKKVQYEGDQLNGVQIGNTQYICIKGDFFQQLCNGETSLVQKASDASSKPVYVGSEALFINGTPGKPGDYFTFQQAGRSLTLVPAAAIQQTVATSFTNCASAAQLGK